MDQKHAMLYPDTGAIAVDQRSSAAAAIGLPVEPPPTYDVATKEATPTAVLGWQSHSSDINYPTSSQYSPHMNHHHLPVIVEQTNFPQPAANQQEPQQPFAQQQQQQQQQQQPQTMGFAIATQSTVDDLSSKLGPNPSTVTCPNCGANKTTRMCYTPNTKTHVSALILCLVGWCCLACIVPYCMNSCRTGNHYCSNCNAFLGAYNAGSTGPRRRHRRRR